MISHIAENCVKCDKHLYINATENGSFKNINSVAQKLPVSQEKLKILKLPVSYLSMTVTYVYAKKLTVTMLHNRPAYLLIIYASSVNKFFNFS